MGIRESILAHHEKKTEPVKVAGWEGVFIKIVSSGEASNVRGIDADARLVLVACVDENGNRIFKDEDLPSVVAMPFFTVSSVAKQALAFNGYDTDEKK